MPEAKREPVKYVLTEKCAVTTPDGNCTVYEAGAEVPYAGLPSANMLPLCDEGVKRRKEAIEYDKTGRFQDPPPIEVPTAAKREAAEQAAKIAARAKKGDEELA